MLLFGCLSLGFDLVGVRLRIPPLAEAISLGLVSSWCLVSVLDLIFEFDLFGLGIFV